MRRVLSWSVCGVMVLIAARSHAQRVDGPVFYPEKLHEDLEVFRLTVHEAHADPYRYITKPALDRLFDRVRDGITVPMDAIAFTQALNPVVQAIADAHTGVHLPEPIEQRIRLETPLLPILVAIRDGRIHLRQELKAFRSIPPGSELVSINGIGSATILERILPNLRADGVDTTHRMRRIEADFPYLYHRHVEQASVFDIRYRGPQGRVAEQRIFALTGREMLASQRSTEERRLPWSTVLHKDLGTLWWSIRSLKADTLLKAGIKPERFLETLRKDLRKEQVRVLVVDLRGAEGGDLALAEAVHSIFAQRKYRVVQDMVIRSKERPTHYALSIPVEEFYTTTHAAYLPGEDGTHVLRPDDPRLEYMEPVAKPFDGKVYIVCDGLTTDAAAALVMMAGRAGRARVVGEEIGTNATRSCGGRSLRIKAPNSSVVFEIPLIRYVYEGVPSGPPDRGELPHHHAIADARALANGRDAVKESLLELIMELQ